MRPAALVIILTFAATTACHAQAMPSIKGHTLGETIQQFVAESNDITKAQVTKCEASGGKDQYEAPWFACEDFMNVVKSGSGSFSCEDPMYQLGLCRAFRGKVTFQENKLVDLNLEITDREWDDALADVVSKFGKPDELHTDTEENAYGAKFELQAATWVKPEYLVVVFQKLNLPYNLKKFVEVSLVDHKYYQDKHSKQAAHSALD